jgi:hypothetical protein
MKSKPKGAKYRNLFARGGVIYYERLAHGRRIRISAKTSSWEDAAWFRDAFEAHEGIGKVPLFARRWATQLSAKVRWAAQRDEARCRDPSSTRSLQNHS